MSIQENDRTQLTFSQAEGIDPLPQTAALYELPEQARLRLWNRTYAHLSNSITPGDPFLTDPWDTILRDHLGGGSMASSRRVGQMFEKAAAKVVVSSDYSSAPQEKLGSGAATCWVAPHSSRSSRVSSFGKRRR